MMYRHPVRWVVPLVVLGLNAGMLHAQPVIQVSYTIPPFYSAGWFRAAENMQNGLTLTARPVQYDSTDVFDAVLLHTGSDGELLWSTEYDIPGSQAALYITPAGDGGSWVLISHTPDASTNRYGMLLRVDENDQPMWGWVVDPPDSIEVEFLSMAAYASGGVALIGYVKDLGTQIRQVLITRVHADGSVAWSTRVEEPGLTVLDAVVVRPDEVVSVAGHAIAADGAHGASLTSISGDGSSGWATIYGSGTDARGLFYRPDAGYLIMGSSSADSVVSGLLIHADDFGTATQARLFAHEVINGHPLADGSMVLFFNLPGGISTMERVDAQGNVPWTAALGTNIGYSQMVPYAEGSRYAFITGDFVQTINVSTFSSQCQSCSGEPAEAFPPVDATIEQHEPDLQLVPYDLPVVPVSVSTSTFNASGSTACFLWLGLEEADAPAASTCAWNAETGRLIVVLPITAPAHAMLLDAAGRMLPAPALTRSGEQITVDVHRYAMSPGVYLLRVGDGASERRCRFVVPGLR